MMLKKIIGVQPQRLLTCKTLSTSLTPYILYYYISLHGLHLILKTCNAVLVNPAWSVAPVGVCTPFLPCKAKITFTLKYYFCVNCCGCICKKKVVKGKGYIILVYSAQLLVFHDST